MKKILTISRPRFWIYTAGPFWLSIALLYPIGMHLLPALVMLVYFTFPANLLIYGINDVYDRATDELNIKKHSYEHVLRATDQHHVVATILLSNIPFWLYAIVFLPMVANVFLLMFIVLAWQYSAPPLRAKARPFLDSFVSGLLYIVPVGVSWGLVTDRTPEVWPMLAGFFWSYAMHVYSAIPDIHADTAAGITTSATLLGKNKTIALCGIFYSLAALIAYFYVGYFAIIILSIYVVLLFFSYKKKTPEEMLSVYKIFPLINTMVGGLLFIIFLCMSLGILVF